MGFIVLCFSGILPLQFSVVGTHSAIMGTTKVASKEEFVIVRALFSSTKILPLATIIERETRLTDFFSPPSQTIIEIWSWREETGLTWRDTLEGHFCSKLNVFEGYKNKGLLLQIVSLFFPFKQIPLSLLYLNLSLV